MKYVLLIVALLFSSLAQSALTRNMATDPVSGVTAESCNLYRGSAVVVNTPVIVTVAGVACSFPSIPLQPSESYTATYVNAVGFEGAASLPFATGTAPGKSPVGLKPAP